MPVFDHVVSPNCPLRGESPETVANGCSVRVPRSGRRGFRVAGVGLSGLPRMASRQPFFRASWLQSVGRLSLSLVLWLCAEVSGILGTHRRLGVTMPETGGCRNHWDRGSAEQNTEVVEVKILKAAVLASWLGQYKRVSLTSALPTRLRMRGWLSLAVIRTFQPQGLSAILM